LSSNFQKVKHTKQPYVIPFAGLKIGKHQFGFTLTETFFEEQGYQDISAAEVDVQLELDKKESMLIAQFVFAGEVTLPCDRCTDDMKQAIACENQVIYKFGHEESDDENLVVLHPDEHAIDVKDLMYELIIVSLPSKMVHPAGECNEEMMATLDAYLLQSEEDDDEDEDDDDDESPWSILKNLN